MRKKAAINDDRDTRSGIERIPFISNNNLSLYFSQQKDWGANDSINASERNHTIYHYRDSSFESESQTVVYRPFNK